MEKEIELSTGEMLASFLNAIAYLISPILLIWSVNTLFNCGIDMSFKTWLAGIILIMLMRFHLRSPGKSYEDEYYYDEEENDEYYDDDDPERQKIRLKSKLMTCQDHKNKKNSSDES